MRDMDPEVDREGVAELHAEVLYMLSEVARLAEESGLGLYAAYGTLLGAVRDRELIPWDEDADLWVPTRHYAALCDYLREHLPPTLRLLDPEADPEYEFLLARVAPRGVDHKLVYIDLFPLSGAPSSHVAQRLFTVVTRLLFQAFLMKRVRLEEMHHYSARKRLVARVAKVVLAPVPDRVVLSAYRRFVALFDRPSAATMSNPCGSYGEREFWDARWFAATTPVEISGIKVPAPVGYDDLLRFVYGNYMQPVDETRQREELLHLSRYYVRPLRELGWRPSEGAASWLERPSAG